MKKAFWVLSLISLGAASFWAYASDFLDASLVAATSSDIVDYYVFESPENPENMVFIATVQGLIQPGKSSEVTLDEDVLVQFKIDVNGDLQEDKVIQCFSDSNGVYTYGAVRASQLGDVNLISAGSNIVTSQFSAYDSTDFIMNTTGEVSLFVGVVDDPFYMDLTQVLDVTTEEVDSFESNAIDTYQGMNTVAFVVEVPKLSIGVAEFNTWATTSRLIKK